MALNAKNLRKTVYNIGINDLTTTGVNYHFYRRWHAMMKRCYSKAYHRQKPTYSGCTVCEEWLLFSNFKKWMEKQDWEGNCLDKDVLKSGNTVYSPENCCFISVELNNLLINQANTKNGMPCGVRKNRKGDRFIAYCSYNNNDVHIGTFDTIQHAKNAYLKHKSDIIYIAAQVQKNELVKAALIELAGQLSD